MYAAGLAANCAVGLYGVPRFGAAGAVAGAVSGEICIFACWVAVGKLRLRNLPLAWGARVAVLAVAAAFLAFYRPDFLGLGAPGVERCGLTLLIGAIGVPLARRLWRSREEFFGSAKA